MNDEDITKNPFYGYYKSRGLIKYSVILLDKLIILAERAFLYFIKTKKRKEIQLSDLKKKVNLRESHYDNKSFYIKNFYTSFLNLFKDEKLKIGIYEQPIRLILTFIGSFYGHLRLNQNKNIKKITNNYKSLNKKKVLIIGTGDSINKIDKNLLNHYDHIFLLNNAIKIYNDYFSIFFDKNKFSFFCADRHRIDQLSRDLKNSNLDRKRKLYFPDYPLSILKVDLRRQKLSIIGGHKPWKIIYTGFGIGNLFGWHMFYPDDPINKLITSEEIKNWICKNSEPVYLPYSVVFGCIAFIAGFKPSNIDLIGCDFTGNFVFKPMDDTFSFLSQELMKYKIVLRNISFQTQK